MIPRTRSCRIIAMGLWLLLVATNPGRNETTDVEMRRLVARQIWSAGTVTVPSPKGGYSMWIPTEPGRWVAPYGVGQSLLFVPFDMAGFLLEQMGPKQPRPTAAVPGSADQMTAETWGDRVGWLPIGFGLLPLLGVGYWAAVRALLQEWGFVRPWPTLGSLTLVLGTIAFHYAGQPQEETLIGLCLTLSVLFAMRLRHRSTWRNALLSGAFAGACILTRPVSVFALLIVPVLIATVQRNLTARVRLLTAAGVSGGAAVCVALWYNFARFGNVFETGYERLGVVAKLAFDGRWLPVFASLLVGPGVGLLILSPVLAIAVYGAWRLWPRDRWYAAGMLLAVLSSFGFFAAWHESYTGGVAWGARYQVHLLPLLAVPLTLGLEQLSRNGPWRRFAIGLVVVSLGIQGLSVFATHHLEHYQAACDGMQNAPLRNSVVDGQLGRRVENVIRWTTGGVPRPVRDAQCGPTIALMWERYMPNFWGPVIAHRLAGHGRWLLVAWSLLLPLSLLTLWSGIRQEIRSAGSAAIPATHYKQHKRSGK